MFEKYKILSDRQISRMLDADLLTELCQVCIDGIFSRSHSKLEALYRNNDIKFLNKHNIELKLTNTLDFIKIELNKVCENEVLKSYSFYSLFSALIYNKWGINNITNSDSNNLKVINKYSTDKNIAIQNILELFNALDERDEKGKFGEFVKASTGTTHSKINRTIRLKWLVTALQNKL